MTISNVFVAKTVEKSLGPRLVDQRCKFGLFDLVLNLGVEDLSVDLSLEEEVVVLKAESGAVRHGGVVLLINHL